MTDKDQLAQAAMAPKSRLEVQEAHPHRNAPLETRMRARAVEAPTGCWEWQGQVNNLGYGVVGFKADHGWTTTTAHRKFYELTVGPIPDGIQVNHHCDNRRCINPDHLFLGTQTDNIRDMMAKRRDNFRGKGAYLKRKLSEA
jgi:hypothetical protein